MPPLTRPYSTAVIVFNAFMADPLSHDIPPAAEGHVRQSFRQIMSSFDELFGDAPMTLHNMVRAMLNVQQYLLDTGFFEELFRLSGDEHHAESMDREQVRLRLYQFIVDNPTVLDAPQYAQLDRVVYAMNGSADTLQAVTSFMVSPEIYPWEVGDQFILQPRLLMMSHFAFPGIELPG